MFIDLETIGFPKKKRYNKFYNPEEYRHYDNARIIEIGYLVCDIKGNIFKQENLLIKPENFEINNSHIHGITNKEASEKGININEALEILQKDLITIDKIIAHNSEFDINILLSECYRNKNLFLSNDIELKNIECTMQIGQDILKLDKYPKLVELYKNLFDKTIDQSHRALSDATICKDCYFALEAKI